MPISLADVMFFMLEKYTLRKKQSREITMVDNDSGHYIPVGSYAHQAGLPMNLFRAAFP